LAFAFSRAASSFAFAFQRAMRSRFLLLFLGGFQRAFSCAGALPRPLQGERLARALLLLRRLEARASLSFASFSRARSFSIAAFFLAVSTALRAFSFFRAALTRIASSIFILRTFPFLCHPRARDLQRLACLQARFCRRTFSAARAL